MLHRRLKDETKHIHAQLEKNLLEKITAIESVTDYVELLSLMHGYYSRIETDISKYIETSAYPDYSVRRKSKMILGDIELLHPAFSHRHACAHLPSIASEYSALGALYVLEGSTLGGRIVADMIGKKIHSDKGFTFLLSYGPRVVEMWEQFKSYLSRPYTETQEAEIVQGAKETFLTFNNWLTTHEQ